MSTGNPLEFFSFSRVRATVAALLVAAVLAGSTTTATAQKVTRVKVESVKPMKTKYPTLRFLRENRDFIRSRLDLLRQTSREEGKDADTIDPRFLAYQEMLNEIFTARDSVSAVEDARRRRALLESISQLGSLEEQLDLVDSLLAGQRSRLAALQRDFTGHQKTSLMVLLSGFPRKIAITEVAVRVEDGITVRVPITPEMRSSLESGGIAEIYHEFLEPRDQVIEIAFRGEPWPDGNSGFVTLVPAHNRLTFLKLDIGRLDATGVGVSLGASTWLHQDHILSSAR